MRWKAFLVSRRAAGLLLLAAVALVYTRSLGNDFVIWDDDSLVFQNPLTQELTANTVWGAFTSYDPELYVPLTIVSFQIEHALFGFHPLFFHLDNLLLHALNAFLVLLLLERLGVRRRTAFLCALLFALHPVNTEAVAWVSARKDLLATAFSLGAMLNYLMHRRTGTSIRKWMTVSFVLCAVLSKPIAIVLPAAFLLLDWKETGRLTKRDWTGKLPIFALSGLFLIIGLFGKQRNIGALSLGETLLLASKSAVFSVQKFFWPTGLSPIYLQTDPISISLPQFWIPLVILIVSAVFILFSLRHTRLLAFSALFFMLFLFPSFANFAKDDIYYFSDRYIYLSQIGILFLMGILVDRILTVVNDRTGRIALAAVATPVLLLFAYSAHAQSLLWKDSETLYRSALLKNNRSVVMHYNLAVLEHRRGNREAALLEYQKALTIDPEYAQARANLGVFYKEEGRIDKALDELRRAIESDPSAPEPHNTVGSILMDQGDVNGAIAAFRKSIEISETYAQAHINLGSALGRKGLYDEGLREYRRAFELAPQLLEGLPEIRRALESLE